MLTPVTLSGNYLATAGRRFIPIGVNWVPARAAMQWPYEWDSDVILVHHLRQVEEYLGS